MKRIKKLIIANLVVILLAIIIFTASMYFGGPVLEQGSRDILVLAGEQDEQQGGSVDMAYMVHLENGSLAKRLSLGRSGPRCSICTGNSRI